MIRRDYGPATDELPADRRPERQKHGSRYEPLDCDIGASGGSPVASNSRLAGTIDGRAPSAEVELKAERERNAVLTSKLKKMKARNRELINSKVSGPSPRYSRIQSTNTSDNQQTENESLSASMNNLSFATLNVPECKPLNDEDEIDKRSFETWRTLLEASMQLVGVTNERIKMSIFQIKAGPKLLDILENTSSSCSSASFDISPYSNAMDRLRDYFGSRDYTLLQRQKLRSLTQMIGESDVKYVKRVINLTKLCDYNESQTLENVADVIQSHALNLNVRELGRKVLRKGGTIPALLEKFEPLKLAN
ncbi:uncharacterized protein LOC134209812 [Armigeres subalbatus]|uniref:uncharacterized protein LOC134209812 n=1 Tax=Armigeres subalbatus TaxID=124917 RepID=UPI002ED5F51F